MKTQITINTTRNQEIMVGLAQTGELVKANRAEIATYMEGLVDAELERLEMQAKTLINAVASRANVEV